MDNVSFIFEGLEVTVNYTWDCGSNNPPEPSGFSDYAICVLQNNKLVDITDKLIDFVVEAIITKAEGIVRGYY